MCPSSPMKPTATTTPRLTRSRTKLTSTLEETPIIKVDEDLEMAVKKTKRKAGAKKSVTASRKKNRKEQPLEPSAPKAEITLEASTSSDLCVEEEEEESGVEKVGEVVVVEEKKKTGSRRTKRSAMVEDNRVCRFVGSRISGAEARRRWPNRYQKKRGEVWSTANGDEPDDDAMPAKCHYERAQVDGKIYHLQDDVYVKAEAGNPDYIGHIVEFFEAMNGQFYFTAQWFFRAEDTVIGKVGDFHDPKRVFLSDEKNINVLDCIVSKINIVQRDSRQIGSIPTCDLYYNMYYSIPYSSFTNLPRDKSVAGSEESSTVSYDDIVDSSNETPLSAKKAAVLDLFSGCGAMSTGLCHGAQLAGLNIETTWAVDINSDACRSFQLNHPNTKVRNESAEHFLALLKEWEKLCKKYSDQDSEESSQDGSLDENDGDESDEEFVVEKFLDICYGDPANIGKNSIQLKVRWEGYGPDEDTWEPIENLGNCDERLGNFVRWGMKTWLLPLPGDVDVVCGGPPCQGISGFNRFRKTDNPLDDEKNRQMITYMDIVDHLKPRFVLMENVVDILKFSKGFLGRYALSFLVSRNYQARLGIMAAGCYGLPQFRLRVFLWGAQADEILPQFPLPTYNVVVRGGVPNEFEQNLVAYDEGEHRELKEALLLSDAIFDLPSVTNFEERDEMPYDKPPKTEFQRFIRTPKYAMLNSSSQKRKLEPKLFDHRPLKLNTDDYQRVQKIPKFKGANFRNLPGLRVGPDNVIELDSTVERPLLPSGKPLVPDYAISFIKGKSLKPFGRLWWDETVPTVVTRAEPHNQVILHPEQDRVLTIRENARLQGFPDHYRLLGSIKGRYIQVGNAVAFPVSRALGYTLGSAYQKQILDDGPLLKLPKGFPLLPD